jgi:CheY-like chemotaxis protein
MLDLLRRTIGEQVLLSSILAPGLWQIHSDPSEIENAVLNLAINARDAMASGGRLVLETRNCVLDEASLAGEIGVQPGEYTCLSVSDTGKGMPPEVLARVFEPFFTTKETGKGTGLGLSVVYGFARQSGGHVTIYSEVGRGTTVNLYLARARADTAEHPLRGQQSYSEATAGETILVVEDQPQVREVTLKRLKQLGYDVIEADGPASAIKILELNGRIDLVFSDVVMPGGMSGFDLAQWLTEKKPGIGILLTSGFADDVVRTGWPVASTHKILRKPYSRDELARAIRESIGRDR